MMGVSNTQLRIIKRAIKRRLANGEMFDEIIADYPKLSEEQIEQIKIEYGISNNTENVDTEQNEESE